MTCMFMCTVFAYEPHPDMAMIMIICIIIRLYTSEPDAPKKFARRRISVQHDKIEIAIWYSSLGVSS